jgi:hypothetical protein
MDGLDLPLSLSLSLSSRLSVPSPVGLATTLTRFFILTGAGWQRRS